MDADRFDTVARSLSARPSRRGMLAGLASGLLALLALRATGEDAAAKKNKRGNGRKKSCKGGQKRCGGKCVNTRKDPRNCGRCGKRCQLNANCSRGNCTCVRGACPASDATCCPASAVRPDVCRCTGATNPGTCETEGAVEFCAPGTVACLGPRCGACCPSGSKCDSSTGTCLRD